MESKASTIETLYPNDGSDKYLSPEQQAQLEEWAKPFRCVAKPTPSVMKAMSQDLPLKKVDLGNGDFGEYFDNLDGQKREGIPYIALPGFARGIQDFKWVANIMKQQNVWCVALNIPGLEYNEKVPLEKITWDYCVEIMYKFVIKMEYKKVIWLPHCFGSFVACMFGEKYPELTAGIAFVASPPALRVHAGFFVSAYAINCVIRDKFDNDIEKFHTSIQSSAEERTKTNNYINDYCSSVNFGSVKYMGKDVSLKLTLPLDEYRTAAGITYMLNWRQDILKSVNNLPPFLKLFFWGDVDFIFEVDTARYIAYQYTEGDFAVKRFTDQRLIQECREKIKTIPEGLDNLQKHFLYEIRNEFHKIQMSNPEFVAAKLAEFAKACEIVEGTEAITCKL